MDPEARRRFHVAILYAKSRLVSAVPLFVFLFMIVWMYLGLTMSRLPPIDLTDPDTITVLRALAAFLNISGSDPLLAVLQAVNTATMIYGFIFYVVRTGEDSTSIPLLTGIIFFAMYFLSFYVKFFEHSLKDKNPSDATYLLLIKEYAMALALNIYFCLIDSLLYYKLKTQDIARARIFGFSATYISFPVVISLAIACLFQHVLFSFGVTADASVAFLAGVTAMVMFVSNLIFALVNAPWYFPNIQISLRGN